MKTDAWIDGAFSSTTKRGGWASILVFDGFDIELSGAEENSTNQRMEMTALFYALVHAPRDKPLRVMTDSAYVMNGCLDRWWVKWNTNGWKTSNGGDVKNRTLWMMIAGHLHQRRYDVEFVKVKGHSNTLMNDRADEIAVRARTIEDYGVFTLASVGKRR